MSLISSDTIKSIIDAQITRMSKTDSEIELEASAQLAVASNFDEITASRIMKYSENITALKAADNGSTVNAAAIKFFERRIAVYSGVKL